MKEKEKKYVKKSGSYGETFATHAAIFFSPYDGIFVIDFLKPELRLPVVDERIAPYEGELEIATRVVMTYPSVKRFLELLATNVEKYEETVRKELQKMQKKMEQRKDNQSLYVG